MSYQVLARKWRPRTFSELVGQEHVVRALSNALDHDRLHHAYLFTGTRGVGKTTLARIFAKSLNCEHGVGSVPCGDCTSCREIDGGRFVDLLEVDAASRTKVDQTRELLENVPYAPVRGRYKVYLIDEVHMFSDSSFNALLKTLEEPPPHVKFLLATTDPQKVPVTVLSRCLQFNLKRLPQEQIREYLGQLLDREGIAHDREALGHLARGADGSMRDALSLMDQAIAFGGGEVREPEVRSMLGAIAQDHVHDLLDALVAQDAGGVLQQVAGLAEMAPDFSAVLQELLALLHRVALAQVAPGVLDHEGADPERVAAAASAATAEDIQLYYQICLIGQRDLPLAPDPRSGFEMVLLRMLAFRPGGARTAAPPTEGRNSPTRGPSQGPSRRRSPGSAPGAAPAHDVPAGGPGKRPPAAGGQGPRVAPERPAAPLELSRWSEVVERLKLGGVARQLANNCSFGAWDGARLVLRLDPLHRQMRVDSSEQRLRRALCELLGCEVRLEIQVGEPADADTPARIQAKNEAQRLREAREAVAGDPLVQALEEQFDARVIPESVRPADH
ncbi:MAG: DNA polymerase III subunit gamma/tau [gamma proteobacterium symbiont of Phacoides pectinatus]